MARRPVGNQQSSLGGCQGDVQVAAPEEGAAVPPAGRALPAGGPDAGARPPGQGHQVAGRTGDEVALQLDLAWRLLPSSLMVVVEALAGETGLPGSGCTEDWRPP